MGTLTIGRLAIVDPRSLEHDGDQGLRVAGWISGSTMDAAKTYRQQMLGLADTSRGEAVLPVTWSGDSSLDGYYRLARPPRVSTVDATYSSIYGFTYELDLVRVDGGHQLPAAESYVFGVTRTGKPGGTTEVYWHAIPSTMSIYDVGARGNGNQQGRTGPGGTVGYFPGAWYASSYARLRIPPANWYDMASTVTINGDVAVGAQTVNAPTSWSLSNGLVKAQAVSGGSASKSFEVVGPAATASSWGTAQGYCLGLYVTSWIKLPTANLKAVEVLRTQPWCSAVRLVFTYKPYTYDAIEVFCDLRLRRGSWIIEATISTSATQTAKYGIEQSGNAAHSVITSGGGLRPDANDADGNRWCLMTGTATDNATAQADLGGSTSWPKGRMYMNTAGNLIDFGIAYERSGGSSAAWNRSTDLRDQYFSAMDEAVAFGVGR